MKFQKSGKRVLACLLCAAMVSIGSTQVFAADGDLSIEGAGDYEQSVSMDVEEEFIITIPSEVTWTGESASFQITPEKLVLDYNKTLYVTLGDETQVSGNVFKLKKDGERDVDFWVYYADPSYGKTRWNVGDSLCVFSQRPQMNDQPVSIWYEFPTNGSPPTENGYSCTMTFYVEVR